MIIIANICTAFAMSCLHSSMSLLCVNLPEYQNNATRLGIVFLQCGKCTNVETEAPYGYITCPGSHSKL